MAYLHQITRTPDSAAYWATQSMFADTVVTEQPVATLGADRVSLRFGRLVPAGAREDDMFISLTLAKIVGGGLYSTLLPAELASAETALGVWVSNWSGVASSGVSCVEYIWHELRANHNTTPKGSEAVGPAVRRTTIAVAGANASSRQPDQLAVTETFRTASRKHWGRIYVPGLALPSYDTTYGRITNTRCDSLATATRTLEASWSALSFQLGIWTWKYKAFLPLSELRVDNVADIIRRRRAKQATYFKSFTS
jgi:hypothetical protein